jgi:hypothetical protein
MSSQYRAAVYDNDLAGAVALPHEVEIGFSNLVDVSNVPDR